MRVPGTRAGLNERSQSPYATPIPKPVNNPMGHVRPVELDKWYERTCRSGT